MDSIVPTVSKILQKNQNQFKLPPSLKQIAKTHGPKSAAALAILFFVYKVIKQNSPTKNKNPKNSTSLQTSLPCNLDQSGKKNAQNQQKQQNSTVSELQLDSYDQYEDLENSINDYNNNNCNDEQNIDEDYLYEVNSNYSTDQQPAIKKKSNYQRLQRSILSESEDEQKSQQSQYQQQQQQKQQCNFNYLINNYNTNNKYNHTNTHKKQQIINHSHNNTSNNFKKQKGHLNFNHNQHHHFTDENMYSDIELRQSYQLKQKLKDTQYNYNNRRKYFASDQDEETMGQYQRNQIQRIIREQQSEQDKLFFKIYGGLIIDEAEEKQEL